MNNINNIDKYFFHGHCYLNKHYVTEAKSGDVSPEVASVT